MIAMSFRTFIIKVLVFILSNLFSIRLEVDTRQLNVPLVTLYPMLNIKTSEHLNIYYNFIDY